jgi:hypothetical protein
LLLNRKLRGAPRRVAEAKTGSMSSDKDTKVDLGSLVCAGVCIDKVQC